MILGGQGSDVARDLDAASMGLKIPPKPSGSYWFINVHHRFPSFFHIFPSK